MNNDLISREVLRNELLKSTIITDDLYGMGIMAGMDAAIKKVNEAPAVDAVEVVHAKWAYKWDAEKDPKRLFVRIVCSNCNLHTGQKSNYCPNCGARMDGE